MADDDIKNIRRFTPDFNWEDVERMPYKEEGTAPFKAISRQILFSDPALHCELRYFEMAADGYSTLERHEHAHGVLILRGQGHVLIGDTVQPVKQNDLVSIPGGTWHQFRATKGEPLGFLCMVNSERDKPQLPTEHDLAALMDNPVIAEFIKGTSGE